MKIKKIHIINLVVDTCLVSILFLLTLASKIDLSLISELLINIGIEKSEAILSVSGVLVLTLILQYKTTLSDAKCEKKKEVKYEETEKAEQVFNELIELFNNGGEKIE